MRRRVIVTHRGGWVDPAAVFSRLCRGGDAAFWLDSGIDASSGVSYLGVASRTVSASVSSQTVTESPSGRRHEGSIFDFLGLDSAAHDVGSPQLGPFALGWVGWLGYELHAQTLETGAQRQSRYPDAAFMFVDRAIAFDHDSNTVALIALDDLSDGARWSSRTAEVLDRLRAEAEHSAGSSAEAEPSSGHVVGAPQATWSCGDAEYLERIEACQAAIRAGDAYQLCLTMQAEVPATPDPVDTYLALRQLSPTHHGGFVRLGEVSLLSASPEQFLTVSASGQIESKPIKGTRPRGATGDDDRALMRELVSSDKERAENLMIVDLMRNDIGRVSEVGSVTVPSLLNVESYAQVHQLVSTVCGQLKAGLSARDAVEACFPAGSMTGAPKFSAVAILDRLEAAPRGIYSGAFGYFGLDGRVELAMVIRSMVIDSQSTTIGSGGGITALSVPREELAEAKLKAAALLRVLGLVA